MDKYNLIAIFSKDKSKVLMCKRSNEPFINLFNFVGGKIEENETSEESAYRELFEETGISKNDTNLFRLLDLIYYEDYTQLEVFVGILENEVELVVEKNELFWIDCTSNFHDLSIFAGRGNMEFIMKTLVDYISSK